MRQSGGEGRLPPVHLHGGDFTVTAHHLSNAFSLSEKKGSRADNSGFCLPTDDKLVHTDIDRDGGVGSSVCGGC